MSVGKLQKKFFGQINITGCCQRHLEENTAYYLHIQAVYPNLMLFQVCTNGIVCLGGYTTSYTARPFPLNSGNIGVIAPYWGDADPSKGGTVWSRVSTDAELLNNISSLGEGQHLLIV